MEREPEKSEEEIQFEILDLLKVGLVDDAIYFHIPNGGHRHISVAKKLKDLGALPGVPDLCIQVPSSPHKIFWLEVKKPTGHLSHEQKNFRDKCLLGGIQWAIVRSRDEAEAMIQRWGIVRPEYASSPEG